jgi:hypothetical protein
MKTLTLQEFQRQAKKIIQSHKVKGLIDVRFSIREDQDSKNKPIQSRASFEIVLFEVSKEYNVVCIANGDTPQLCLAELDSRLLKLTGKKSISGSIQLNK